MTCNHHWGHASWLSSATVWILQPEAQFGQAPQLGYALDINLCKRPRVLNVAV